MDEGARDFRSRLRAIARARARGEEIAPAAPPADRTVPLADIWPAARAEGFWLARPEWPAGYPLPPLPNQEDLAAAPPIAPALGFDVESMGRTPKPLFLIGLVHIKPEGIAFEQYIAAHPDEEGALLAAAAPLIENAPLLVSYNGRTFDIPIVRDRLVWWRRPFAPPSRHVDLLYLVRKHYRARLNMPACNLGEAERYLLGVARPDDLPSSEVPAMYELSVQSGDARPLLPILRHNLYDLAATALLYLKIAREQPAAFAAAEEEEPPPDETAALF